MFLPCLHDLPKQSETEEAIETLNLHSPSEKIITFQLIDAKNFLTNDLLEIRIVRNVSS